MHAKINRRRFLRTSAAGAAGMIILKDSRSARAYAANEKLNIAGIGVGGQGGGNIRTAGNGNNVVALCDVDARRAAGAFKQFPAAKRYQDFRKMLDNEKSIEAVIVATPDHFHTVGAMAAMRRRKHVYVQKPLTRLVSEARALTEAGRGVGLLAGLWPRRGPLLTVGAAGVSGHLQSLGHGLAQVAITRGQGQLLQVEGGLGAPVHVGGV